MFRLLRHEVRRRSGGQPSAAEELHRQVQPAITDPWLGELRPHGADALIADIDIDTSVRRARINGQTDAEVLITTPPCCDPRGQHPRSAGRQSINVGLGRLLATNAPLAKRSRHEAWPAFRCEI